MTNGEYILTISYVSFIGVLKYNPEISNFSFVNLTHGQGSQKDPESFQYKNDILS